MRQRHDFVVVGAGVFGAWTALCLREAGFGVMLLDAYGPANSRSSSGGETRIIRMGYGPDILYTRAAARSLAKWLELGDRTRQKLFVKTGVLWLSCEGDAYTNKLEEVLKNENVRFEHLSAGEISGRFPQFTFDKGAHAVLEPDSGVLMARQAVKSVVAECIRLGVHYETVSVLPPARGGKLEAVETSAEEAVSGGTFVFACGPWLPRMFSGLLKDRIRSTRQEVFFLGPPPGSDLFSVGRMPAWLYHTHPERPYALPDIQNRGVKIAFDTHGPDFDPDSGSRIIGEQSVQHLRAFLKAHVTLLESAPVIETRVCQYENTSNGDLLIDRHPEFENVWIVGGGSGHGFKHGPAIGEYVRDRVLNRAAAEARFSLAAKHEQHTRSVF